MVRLLLPAAALAALMSIAPNVAFAARDDVAPGPPRGCPGELFQLQTEFPGPLGEAVSGIAGLRLGEPGFADTVEVGFEICETEGETPE